MFHHVMDVTPSIPQPNFLNITKNRHISWT